MKFRRGPYFYIFFIYIAVAAVRFSFFSALHASESAVFYPRIENLHTTDALFRQYSQEVSENYKSLARGDEVHFFLYTYKAHADDDLFSIAARCNIPYETIALINNLAFADAPVSGKILYLSTCAGLFIAETPVTPLEFILKTRYADVVGFPVYTVNGGRYVFIPEKKLNATERFFFTDSTMISPLTTGVISSAFGMRISPITGKRSFHNGIDIAAPKGTPVFACKSGIAVVTGIDERYGNYIILQHDNKTQSLYAHLEKIIIGKGEAAVKGGQIGTVGSTGLSTGSHLHFEIQIGGKAQDPSALIKKFLR